MFIKIKTEERFSTWDYIKTIIKFIFRVSWETLKVIGYPFLAIGQEFWPKSIDREVKEYAEEFYWHPGGKPKKAVMLIHGFCTSPIIYRNEYAKLFLEAGYITYAVRIAGHGTSEEDLAATTSVEWYLSIRDKFEKLSEEVDEVLILAHSLGGLIGLILSSLYPVSSIILLSVPIIIKPTPLYRANFLLRPLSNVIKYWPSPRNTRTKIAELGFKAYNKYPLRAVAGLFEMAEVARSRLKYVNIPVLAMLGTEDEHVDPTTIEYFGENLGTENYYSYHVQGASHAIMDTHEEEKLKDMIRDFILKYSPPE